MSLTSTLSLRVRVLPTLRLPRLTTAFCCLSLQAAAQTIAALHVFVIVGPMAYLYIQECLFEYRWHAKHPLEMGTSRFEQSFVRDEFFLSNVIMVFVSSMVLVLGARKADPVLLQPWLFVKSVLSIMSVKLFTEVLSDRTTTVETLVILTYASIDSYMIYAVYSLHGELKGRASDKRYGSVFV